MPGDRVWDRERSYTGQPCISHFFNIVVDSVVWEVLEVVCSPQEAHHSIGWAAGERNLFFYVDDRRISGRDMSGYRMN